VTTGNDKFVAARTYCVSSNC